MLPHHQITMLIIILMEALITIQVMIITALIIQEASMLIRILFHPKDFQSRLSME